MCRFRPECLPAGKPETAKDRDIVAPAIISFVVGTACPGEGDLVNELVQATEVALVALVPFACFQGILMYASPSSTQCIWCSSSSEASARATSIGRPFMIQSAHHLLCHLGWPLTQFGGERMCSAFILLSCIAVLACMPGRRELGTLFVLGRHASQRGAATAIGPCEAMSTPRDDAAKLLWQLVGCSWPATLRKTKALHGHLFDMVVQHGRSPPSEP